MTNQATITDIVQYPQVTNWVAAMSDGTYRWVLPGTGSLLDGGPTPDWVHRMDGTESARWGKLPASTLTAPTATVAHLAALSSDWRTAQAAADQARERLAQACRDAKAAGMSAYRMEQITGASDPTIRKWLNAK